MEQPFKHNWLAENFTLNISFVTRRSLLRFPQPIGFKKKWRLALNSFLQNSTLTKRDRSMSACYQQEDGIIKVRASKAKHDSYLREKKESMLTLLMGVAEQLVVCNKLFILSVGSCSESLSSFSFFIQQGLMCNIGSLLYLNHISRIC